MRKGTITVRGYFFACALLVGCSSTHKAEPDEPKDGGADGIEVDELGKFSFFVTSLASLQELAGDRAGFGGDLRFGESGEGAGLRGADKICATIAEKSMPGASAKSWRAFLSTSSVNAKDRIGEGPWYDRKGRRVADDLESLLKERPSAHDQIINDLPNEFGVPNHDPDGTGSVDNHDMLTGTNAKGTLYCPEDPANCTCDDWTSSARTGRPRVGHSWPRTVTRPDGTIDFGFGDAGTFGTGGFPGLFADASIPGLFDGGLPDFATLFGDGGGLSSLFRDGGLPPGFGDGGFPPIGGFNGGATDGSMNNWMSALDEAGCAPGVSLIEMGPPDPNNATVGSGGGYGGFYCFALTP